MNTIFRRNDKVVLLNDPDPEYVEYHNEDEPGFEEIPIKKGMIGCINIILPNGRYHVEILNSKGETLAYVPMDEEDLRKIE